MKRKLGRILPGHARKAARLEPVSDLDELERSAERHMVALVDVNDRCNLRCGMCGQWQGAEGRRRRGLRPNCSTFPF